MISREMTSAPVPLSDYVPTADHVIVLRGLSWDGFEVLLALRGDRARPKVAYLDGVVELMGTSRTHEGIKSVIGHLIEAYCFERKIPFSAYGNWLQKDRSEEAGVEPDECYVFDANPLRKLLPDLAIEVVWTSGGIEKLEAYRRLKIGEVWYWQKDQITIHVLGPAGYEPRERSACLPDLDLAVLARFIPVEPMSDAVERYREALRGG